VLHQHLDNVSSQAARIRQAADSSVGTPGEAEAADGTETKLSELRAVINYLRKEKEIVDMQLELCKQENARLKTQIGHLTRDLEDTRATLSDVSLPCPITSGHPSFIYPSGKRSCCLRGYN
jgi:nucleoprotein TPR